MSQVQEETCGCCGKEANNGQMLRKCMQCSAVSYCSKECQAKHWREGGHREVCKTVSEDATTRTKEAPAVAAAECEADCKADGTADSIGSLGLQQAGRLFQGVELSLKERGANFTEMSLRESQDIEKAVELWERAAAGGLLSANFNLGICFESGRVRSKPRPEKAFRCFKKAADAGMTRAQDKIGRMYKTGHGVVQNYEAAAKWFQRAAKQGDLCAQYHLSELYKKGDGVSQNPTLASKWLRKAAEQGLQIAQVHLGVACSVENNLEEATRWLKKASSSKDDLETAQIAAGLLKKLASSEVVDASLIGPSWECEDAYQRAQILHLAVEGSLKKRGASWSEATVGEKEDAAKAIDFWLQASADGMHQADYNLSVCFKKGHGVDKPDAKKAFFHLRKAAEAGGVTAQYRLALNYQLGDGVPMNKASASRWFRKAAEQGYPEAQFRLGISLLADLSVAENIEEATKWLKKASCQTTDKEVAQNAHEMLQKFSSLSSEEVNASSIVTSWECEDACQRAGFLYSAVECSLEKRGASWSEATVGEKEDAAKAIDLWLQASAGGMHHADYNLSVCFKKGHGVDKPDAKKAFFHLRKAAEAGDVTAQYNLGFCYCDGDGVAKDSASASRWYRKAAEQGYPAAQYALVVYFCNADLENNIEEATMWLKKASSQTTDKKVAQKAHKLLQKVSSLPFSSSSSSSPSSLSSSSSSTVRSSRECYEAHRKAMRLLPTTLKPWPELTVSEKNDFEKSIKLLKKAAAGGFYQSYHNLAICYHDKGDKIRAFKYWKKAAEAGMAEAQFILAIRYKHGDGIPQNSEICVEWSRKAAKQGHASAQALLGHAYSTGQGVERNMAEAKKWLEKAQTSTDLPSDTRSMVNSYLAKNASQLPPPPSTDSLVGCRVEIQGLTGKPEFNGRVGLVISLQANQRYAIQLDGAAGPIALRRENLTNVDEDEKVGTVHFIGASAVTDIEDGTKMGLSAAGGAIRAEEDSQSNFATIFLDENNDFTFEGLDDCVFEDSNDEAPKSDVGAAQVGGMVEVEDIEQLPSGKASTIDTSALPEEVDEKLDNSVGGDDASIDDVCAVFPEAEDTAGSSLSLPGNEKEEPKEGAPKSDAGAAQVGGMVQVEDIEQLSSGKASTIDTSALPEELDEKSDNGAGVADAAIDGCVHSLEAEKTTTTSSPNPEKVKPENGPTSVSAAVDGVPTAFTTPIVAKPNTENKKKSKIKSECSKGGVVSPAEKHYQAAHASLEQFEKDVKSGATTWGRLQGKREMRAVETWLMSAAKTGHKEAQFSLGELYFNGLGIQKQDRLGIKWWTKASDQGHGGALLKLYLLHIQEGEKQNISLAVGFLKKAAESGNVQAQAILGVKLVKGCKGVDANETEALKWLLKAAEGGEEESYFNLGVVHNRRQNLTEAKLWFLKAAELGNESAMYNVGVLSFKSNNTGEANEWLTKCIATTKDKNLARKANGMLEDLKGDVESEKDAAVDSLVGAEVQVTVSRLLETFRKQQPVGIVICRSSDSLDDIYDVQVHGNIAAIQVRRADLNVVKSSKETRIFLKRCYVKYTSIIQKRSDCGEYVEHSSHLVKELAKTDPALVRNAHNHLRLRARHQEGVDGQAAMMLASAFLEGDGVEINEPEAIKWLKIAADAEDVNAQHTLGLLFFKRRNCVEAVKWWKLASDQGFARATYDLAGLLLEEFKDTARAVELFMVAAMKQKSAPAMVSLGQMNQFGLHGVEKNLLKAGTFFRLAIKVATSQGLSSQEVRVKAEKHLNSLQGLLQPLSPKLQVFTAPQCSDVEQDTRDSDTGTAQKMSAAAVVAGGGGLQSLHSDKAPHDNGDDADDWLNTHREEQHPSRGKKPKAKAKKKKLSAAEIDEKRASFFKRQVSEDLLSHHLSQPPPERSSSSAEEEEETESDCISETDEPVPLSVPKKSSSSNFEGLNDGNGEWLLAGNKQSYLKNSTSSAPSHRAPGVSSATATVPNQPTQTTEKSSSPTSQKKSNSLRIPSSISTVSLTVSSSQQEPHLLLADTGEVRAASLPVEDSVTPEAAALMASCGVDATAVAALVVAGLDSLAALSNASDGTLAECGVKKGPRLKIGKWQKGAQQSPNPNSSQQGTLSAVGPSLFSSPAVSTGSIAADSTKTLKPTPPTDQVLEMDLEAEFLALLAESELAEKTRLDEDEGAAKLVESYCRGLQKEFGGGNTDAKSSAEAAGIAKGKGASTFRGIFNPARDGDCLMRCAVEHDFGGSATTAAEKSESDVSRVSGGSKSGDTDASGVWTTVEKSNSKVGKSRPPKTSAAAAQASVSVAVEQAAEQTADLMAPGSTRALTADELRLKVVACALEKGLAELKFKAAEVEVKLSGVPSASLSEKDRADLIEELARLRGPAVAEVKARFETMARPGVVMGEDELQALADVRGACVEVRSLVCVKESSDFGEVLEARIYTPNNTAQLQLGVEKQKASLRIGKGDTLVLLQEARTHRMSHFQLLRLSLPSPHPLP